MAEIKTYAKPGMIYRYRSLFAGSDDRKLRADPKRMSRELSALEDRYVYCSTYREMNDPMEGFYRASQRVKEKSDYDDFVELVRGQKLQLGIASFSETWNNELMWAHYAGAFAGICIGYSMKKLLAGLPDECALARVAYGDKPYYVGLGAHKEHDRARAILSTKSTKWSYEREWRLFAPNSGRAQYANDSVSCIYLGARMSSADQDRIVDRLKLLGIDVQRTEVDGYSIKRAR